MRALFAVRAGSVRAFTSTADGTEQTVGFYLFGEVLVSMGWSVSATPAPP